MRRGMAGRGSSDRAPIAVTQRGEADVKAAMRAQGSRDRSNLLRRYQSGDRGVGWASVFSPGRLAPFIRRGEASASELPSTRKAGRKYWRTSAC